MVTLTSFPWWVLLPLCLVVVLAATSASRAVLGRWFGAHTGGAVTTAAPLMTGFGALFAFLSAFVIATEWSAQSTADAAVAREASASARLAWSSTADGVDSATVQGAIDVYLTRTVEVEWPEMQQGATVSPTQNPTWQQLERTTRVAAGAPAVSSSASSEMLSALDDLASARRERLDLAARSLPLSLFAILAVSCLALCVNAAVLSLPHSPRTLVVASSVVVVAALDLALVLVLGGPFRGTLSTSPELLVGVQQGIADGFFTL